MKMKTYLILLLTLLSLLITDCNTKKDYTHYVNRFIGSGWHGKITPAAVVPFGMVQCGPNTSENNSAYNYYDTQILGFSHVNKGGSGCSDFHDILFVPLNGDRWDTTNTSYPEKGFPTDFSHKNEIAHPGYYQVIMAGLKTELTVTSRCAMHKYTFGGTGNDYLAIDLKHGSTGACTIVEEDNYDTVKTSKIKIIDNYSIEGYRISNGWAKEQHVYFYAKFSKPFTRIEGFCNRGKCDLDSAITGTDIRSIFTFNSSDGRELIVKVGISPVSCEGARLNIENEIPDWDFERVKAAAEVLWNNELAKFEVTTKNMAQKQLFYTSLYNVMVYPMLYSDVDNRFRGPDHLIHRAEGFSYYGGVIGLWDTFRAAIPLLIFSRPDIVSDYVQTFLEHYKYFGQLPIYTLAGNETFCMIGLPSIPVLADCYFKGIKNYDVSKVYEAMKVSLMRDTIGFPMRYFEGLINYKKYGYVPADIESEATARTLEYAYADWCMARMSEALGKDEDSEYFSKRSMSYKNVFDKNAGFMNGRFTNGEFRPNLNPFYSNHRRDDFCEGNAWQWTFFVPQDVDGLSGLLGGKDKLAAKLDSLFSVSSGVAGEGASGDITGLIGQYAHGNEPSHHIAYMYNYVNQPWKTQKISNQILTTLYDTTENGICGDEDTGQMSAWYVFSSMGFYPMNPPGQKYDIGSPLFDKVIMRLANGKTFSVSAENLSKENIYIQSAKIGGVPLNHAYITYDEIMNGGKLEFIMGDKPNKDWGISE
jgi:predicted alpha-1,2-mannosidase